MDVSTQRRGCVKDLKQIIGTSDIARGLQPTHAPAVFFTCFVGLAGSEATGGGDDHEV